MEKAAPLRPPPPNTIAGFVKLQRMQYGWKQDILAARAGVSLSTIERVERGEAVRRGSIEKLAIALNQPSDAFTRPRAPISDDEAAALLRESFEWMDDCVPVDVAPLRREAQLRDLTDTVMAAVTSDLGDAASADVDQLREWLELTSFVRAEDGTFLPKRERSVSVRKLYRNVLQAVEDLERKHKAVCLVGSYEAKSSMRGFETVRVAVIAVRSRERNPACGKIRRLLAEKKVDVRAALAVCFEGMD